MLKIDAGQIINQVLRETPPPLEYANIDTTIEFFYSESQMRFIFIAKNPKLPTLTLTNEKKWEKVC